MFARKRSSQSPQKLPCLNSAFLTCCLLTIAHVSPMSLDRLGRHYQQKNEKQLQLSEFMLREAESEVLQSEVELVPDLNGTSDMYLLVPATAVNQEGILESLVVSESKMKNENVENNSDMIMLESEDTPVIQILELPENNLENKIGEELIENNELKQESESFISSTNKMHVEDKYSVAVSVQEQVAEMDNSEQNIIGVVMEQSNEASADKLEVESTTETQKIGEALQVYSDGEDSEIQQDEKLTHQSQTILNTNEQTQSDEKYPAVKLVKTLEEENEKTLAESLKNENNQEALQIVTHNEHIKSEKSGNPIVIEEQKIEINAELHDKTEIEKGIKSEYLKVDQNQAAKNTQTEETKTGDVTDDAFQDYANQEQKTSTAGKIQTALKKIEHEEVNGETESQVDEEVESSKNMIENAEPTRAESLAESLTISESKNAEVFETPNEVENTKQSSNPSAAEEIQSNYEIKNETPDYGSQIINEFNKVDKEITPAKEYIISEHLQQKQKEEIHDIEEPQQSVDEQDEEEVKQWQGMVPNAKKTAAVEDETQIENEALLIEDIQNAQETQTNEEYVKELQPSEETQDVKESQDAEEAQTAEEMQHTKNFHAKEEVALPAQNIQTAEEVQHYEEIESIEDVQVAEKVQPTQFIANSQVEFYIESNPSEDIQTDDLIADSQHSIEKETITEEKSQIQSHIHESHSMDGVHSIVSDTEIASSVEKAKAEENIQSSLQGFEFQEHTVDVEQQESEPTAARPADISDNKVISEKFNTNNEDTISQPNVLAVGNTVQNVVPVGGKQNEKFHEAAAETQKPLEDNVIDKNYRINESVSIKETTSMLATIVQVPTKEQVAQQQKVESEQEQEQQSVDVETEGSTTLKPLNVLSGVLNYVNASFMSQMSNDNDNNNNIIKQEVKEEQVSSSKLRRYDGAQVWRIVVQNDRERKFTDELQTKFDGQLWKKVKQEVDYLLKPQVLADAEHHVRAANLSRIVLIENLQKVIEVENPTPEKIAQLQNRKGYRLTWEAYHRLADIHDFFDYLAKVYPDICSVEIIGYSIEKRPLKILKISNGNANNPGIWIDGGMHAREWISPAVVTYIANQIAEGWDELPPYMRNINWYVHAVANPDGYEYSHTTDRLWRKNMRSHGRVCPGVDLNRNFGYKWGGKGTSANPCSQTYRGSKAFSEPETFYISKFISNFPRETFKAYLSFHSYGQYILYPWGYDYHITNDMADLDLVARQAGTIITKSTGAKFTVGSSANTLYPAAGGSDDWARGIAGIKYSYTIEMGDTGRYGFILPAEYIEPNGRNGMTFAQFVAKTIITGKNGRRRKLKLHKTH